MMMIKTKLVEGLNEGSSLLRAERGEMENPTTPSLTPPASLIVGLKNY